MTFFGYIPRIMTGPSGLVTIGEVCDLCGIPEPHRQDTEIRFTGWNPLFVQICPVCDLLVEKLMTMIAACGEATP